jgi:hypothetical protein
MEQFGRDICSGLSEYAPDRRRRFAGMAYIPIIGHSWNQQWLCGDVVPVLDLA